MMMELLQGGVLGLIQGITEFFPVSSSGHLILLPALLNWQDQGMAFDTILHLGTLVAVLYAFRMVIRTTLGGALNGDRDARRLLLQVICASIPGVLAGGLLGSVIERAFRGPMPVAFDLAFWGIVLFAADHLGAKRYTTHDFRKVSWFQAIVVGFSQILALLPGTSRSGITMTGGLLAGMDRSTAVQFSFLVSIPTIAAAGAYGAFSLLDSGEPIRLTALATGFIVSVCSGVLAIKFLRSYVEKHHFDIFVAYRLLLALFVVLVLA